MAIVISIISHTEGSYKRFLKGSMKENGSNVSRETFSKMGNYKTREEKMTMFHVKHRCNLRKQRVKFVKCIYVILIVWIMNMSKDHVQEKTNESCDSK